MADKCAVVGHMRETRGELNYEGWRGVIGLLTFCEDGRELAQGWSWDDADWQTKYDSWDSGPTTCEFFASRSEPSKCEGCPFRGKITSPIQLGQAIPAEVVPELPEPVEERSSDAAPAAAQEVKTFTPTLPEGFDWSGGRLSFTYEDKDGIPRTVRIAKELFYPTDRVFNSDSGVYRVRMRVHRGDGDLRDFEIPTAVVASPADLAKALREKGDVSLSVGPSVNGHITNYVNELLHGLKQRAKEVVTMTSFGWKDDFNSFLIGNRLHHADGRVTNPVLSGYAAAKQHDFPPPRGTLEGYVNALNLIYARAGMEPLQYAIATMFGSILAALPQWDEYHGMLFTLYGHTGKGKTTAGLAACYAFGDARRMKISKDATDNARYAKFGAYNNLPALLDEVIPTPGPLSQMCYTISDGMEKDRKKAGKDGTTFQEPETWTMQPVLTTNTDMYGMLAMSKRDTEAEGMRLWQVNVGLYPIPILEDNAVSKQLVIMSENLGCAGEAYIQYVVRNLPAVKESITQKLDELSKVIPESKYRFFRNHAACTLTAVQIMKEQLGINFDYDKLRAFAVNSMGGAVKTVQLYNIVTPEDAFNYMINEFSKGIIVTHEVRDGREARGVEEVRIAGEPFGRYVLGTGDGDRKKNRYAGMLWLSKKAVREWCLGAKTDFSAVLEWLKSRDALVSESEKFTLGKGTNITTGMVPCVVIQASQLDMTAAKPVIDLVKGGIDAAGTDG